MKNLKLVLAVFAISFASLTATATESGPKSSNSELRTQIVSLLGSEAPSSLTDGQDVKASVSIMLNNKNQIIVLSIDSKSGSVETFVKSKLNYQTIDVKGLKKGEIYRVPLTIKQS